MLAQCEAIVVQYRAPELEGLLASLRTAGLARIWVVDNSAMPASEAEIDGVTWVRPGHNLGYGAAVNRVLGRVEAPFLAILNPDLRLRAASLAGLVGFLESHPEVGLVGPRIETGEGATYPSHRRFPSLGEALGHAVLGRVWPDNRFTKAYREEAKEVTGPIACDWVSGACVAARVGALRAVGGFDPRYRLYLEDVDLCRRLWLSGSSVWFDPEVTVVHVGGTSTGGRRLWALWQHHRSMLIYGTLGQRSWLAAVGVAAGVLGRFVVLAAVAEVRRTLVGPTAPRS